jgi:hypothetical protein
LLYLQLHSLTIHLFVENILIHLHLHLLQKYFVRLLERVKFCLNLRVDNRYCKLLLLKLLKKSHLLSFPLKNKGDLHCLLFVEEL